MISKWIIPASKVLIVVGLVCLLVVSIFWPVGSLSATEKAENLWHHNCLKFYNEAANRIIAVASKIGVSTVCLLPEINTSGYMCSMPCNAGLAIEIDRQARLSGHPIEIIWWDGYIVSDLWSRLISDTSSWPNHGWRRGTEDDLVLLTDTQVSQAKNQAVTVEIIISEISVDKGGRTFQATFGVKTYSGEHANDTNDTKTYTGSTEQIRWFVKKNIHFVWAIIAILTLIGSGIYMAAVYFFHKGPAPPEDFVGPLSIITGMLFFLVIISVRFDRQKAFYYKPNNLFFLVDRNNELFFSSAVGKQSKVRYDPRFVIENTCLAVLEKLSDQKYIRSDTSFFRWLFSGEELHYLYEPPKYELNQRWNPFLYFCSGREEWPTTLVGVSTPRQFVGAFGDKIFSKRFYRESRLILPLVEVQEIVSKLKIPQDQPQIALLFTSDCTPHRQEALTYFKQLSSMNRDKRAKNLNRGAFTVFLPTLPCTGSPEMYNFEQGKLLFASLGSDMVIQTNTSQYNLETVWTSMAEQLGVRTDIQTPNTSAGWRNNHFADIVQIPIYQLKDFSWDNRARWDNPTDLELLRTKLLTIEDTQKVRSQCAEIATLFAKFAEGRIHKEQESEYTIYVLGSVKLDMTLLVSGAAVLCLFIFHSQYNRAFLHYYLQERYIRIWDIRAWGIRTWDWFCMVMSFVALLWYFFLVIWRTQEPMAYAFRGRADTAFIGIILLWLALFASPFLSFRLCYWFDFRGDNALRIARVMTGSVVAIFAALIVCSDLKVHSYILRFSVAISICLIILILLFLLELFRRPRQRGLSWGLLGIWQYPTVSCISKCALIVLFAYLTYGAVTANSATLELGALIILFVWVIIGIIIIISKKLTVSER